MSLEVIRKLKEHDVRFDKQDARNEEFVKKFDQIDKRFDGVNKRFDGVEKRLDGHDQRLQKLEVSVDFVLAKMKNHEKELQKIGINIEELKTAFKLLIELLQPNVSFQEFREKTELLLSQFDDRISALEAAQ